MTLGRKCFSHTLLGDWVKGGVKVIRVTFCLPRASLTCVVLLSEILPLLKSTKNQKESNQPKSDSRALRRLDPYNTSPREEENPERSSRHSSGEKARSRPSQSPSRSGTRSRSRSPSEPPQWARELLKNQEEYRKK